MKFKLKQYEHLEKRYSYKFAFFPVKCSDNILVWLEKYMVVERFNKASLYDTEGAWYVVERHALKDDNALT